MLSWRVISLRQSVVDSAGGDDVAIVQLEA